MNTQTTPPDYRVPFSVDGNVALIADYSAKGVIVEVDATRRYACACFGNTNDYNDFKAIVKA